jgi:hypothetical protein
LPIKHFSRTVCFSHSLFFSNQVLPTTAIMRSSTASIILAFCAMLAVQAAPTSGANAMVARDFNYDSNGNEIEKRDFSYDSEGNEIEKRDFEVYLVII